MPSRSGAWKRPFLRVRWATREWHRGPRRPARRRFERCGDEATIERFSWTILLLPNGCFGSKRLVSKRRAVFEREACTYLVQKCRGSGACGLTVIWDRFKDSK